MTEWMPGPRRPEDEPVPKAPEPVRPDPLDLPPDVPRSATGRVPQWVLDEAAGRPSEPVPWRAWEGGAHGAAPASGRRSRWKAVAAVAVVGAMIAGVAVWANQPRAREDIVAFPAEGATEPSGDDGSRPMTSDELPTEGVGETPRPDNLPLSDLRETPSEGYNFSDYQVNTTTSITWSPCRPIPWVVRGSARAPKDGDRMLREAFARVARATGLDFVYEGTTKEKFVEDREPFQRKRYGDRWAPVLVRWSTVKEDPQLSGDVLGSAGPIWVDTYSGDRFYASGLVSLDAAELEQVRVEDGYPVARAVVMHELGHLVGLAHSTSKASLMYPESSLDVVDFSKAELRGLEALGGGLCQPDG